MLGSLGVPELLIILVIVILLFGVSKLPKLGRGLGEGIRNLKDGMREARRDQPGAADESAK